MNKQTRGERNNNPGNLRRTSIRWQGLAAEQTDQSFVSFTSPKMGIRALGKTLITYSKVYGLNTVRSIVNRYAPTNENDTDAYINSVADSMGVDPDDRIDLSNSNTLEQLVRAIIKHENGRVSYDDETIQAAVDSALGIA